jgi:hypothetical protein
MLRAREGGRGSTGRVVLNSMPQICPIRTIQVEPVTNFYFSGLILLSEP